MNQKMLVIAGIIVLAIAGLGGFLIINSQKSSPSIDDAMVKDEKMMKDEDAVKKDDAMMDKSSNSGYIEYSKSNLENASDKRRVLFFYASWCPTCRPTDQNINSNIDKIPEDLVVIRVNYNDPDTDADEKELAKKYNVTYQHTFVQIDSNGNEIAKWNGGQIEELLANIK